MEKKAANTPQTTRCCFIRRHYEQTSKHSKRLDTTVGLPHDFITWYKRRTPKLSTNRHQNVKIIAIIPLLHFPQGPQLPESSHICRTPHLSVSDFGHDSRSFALQSPAPDSNRGEPCSVRKWDSIPRGFRNDLPSELQWVSESPEVNSLIAEKMAREWPQHAVSGRPPKRAFFGRVYYEERFMSQPPTCCN